MRLTIQSRTICTLQQRVRNPLLLRKTITLLLVERNMASSLLDELPDGLHVPLCGAGSPLPDPKPSGGGLPSVPQEFCESTMSPTNATIAALRRSEAGANPGLHRLTGPATGTRAERPNHFPRPIATRSNRATLSQVDGGFRCVQGITRLEPVGAAVVTVIVAEA